MGYLIVSDIILFLKGFFIMNKGKFIWLCGSYVICVNLDAQIRLTELKDDYKLKLERDALILHFKELNIPLEDEQIEVYRLKKGISLSQVTGLSDYDEIFLPIDSFSGNKELLKLQYILLSVRIS